MVVLTAKMAAMRWNVTGRHGTPRRVLQNRRLQVRFLSHLPEKSEFMQVAAISRAAYIACVDPNTNNTGSHTNSAQLVIDILVRQGLQQFWASQQQTSVTSQCLRTVSREQVSPLRTALWTSYWLPITG
jgi:hypothetical protein